MIDQQNGSEQKIKLIIAGVLALGVLAAGISAGVYFMYLLPKYNSDQLDLKKQELATEQEKENAKNKAQEIEAAEKKKEQEEKDAQTKADKASNAIQLDLCLQDAEDIYAANWANSCIKNAENSKTFNESQQNNYKDCVSRQKSLQYGDVTFCSKPMLFKVNEAPDCTLPSAIASRWDETRDKAKVECHRRYDK